MYLFGLQVAGVDELPAEGVPVLHLPVAQQLGEDVKWLTGDHCTVRHLQCL